MIFKIQDGLLCCPVAGQPWVSASEYWISQGIDYLNGLGRCGVNPTSCVRLSCSWGAGIYLCNDVSPFKSSLLQRFL